MARTIELTRGKVAVVDDEDYQRVSQYQWHAHHRRKGAAWYARTNLGKWPNQKPVYLHRFIMKAKQGQIVDHIDGNGLNCQKDNLRFCTHSQNQRNAGIRKNNKSGYKGVSWNRRDGKWYAQITVNRRLVFLGSFDDKIDAAKAYDLAAKEYYGEFAWTNF